MKNLKSQVVGYGLLFAGFVIAFFVVSSSEELFRIDPQAKAKSTQELQTALNQLEQVCGKGMHVTAEDEFIYGRVCGKSKSLQIEVEHLRKKAQTAENEIEGQFWLSVMVLGFVIGGGFPVRFVSLIIPQLYFLLGWSALANATLTDLLIAQGSVILALVSFNFWVSKKRLQPFVTSIWQDLLSLRLTPKFLIKLMLPYKVAKFEVTPKGQLTAQAESSRTFDLFVDVLTLFTVLAVGIAVCQMNDSGISVISFFWTIMNLIRLLFVRTALRNERAPQLSEMHVRGEFFNKLWIERGENLHSIADCLISESRILNQQGAPIQDALIQLMTEEGLANVGYTDGGGAIVFFTEKTKALWLSSLVAAGLSELKMKEQKSYNSMAAFFKILNLAVRGRYA